ncbi:MAG: hypothetical protein IT359_04315 [Gemmatimonadaceae bacterium]|nr:hypothetical protein [Gemmatimonadaceae bacterium]
MRRRSLGALAPGLAPGLASRLASGLASGLALRLAPRLASGAVLRLAAALVLALVLAQAPAPAGAQVPLYSMLPPLQNPRGLHWERLDTPHFTIVFPDSLAHEAQRAANLLERSYDPLTRTLASRPERIPVVLNNTSMTSNAFVAWGPRRTKWYAFPSTTIDDMGPIEWYSLLAVHEGRHIVQERSVRTGIVGILARLFGDNTTAFLGGQLYFPSWFWEGDAVGSETALTNDGRGRQPRFGARVRALAQAGARYEYYPAWMGTYRTYYPDWYEHGYLLTTHVRRVYGDSAWRRIIRRAARNPVAPMALGMALRKETGRSLVQLHRDAIAAFDSTWRAARDSLAITPATVHPLSRADYHEFTLPQYAGDGSLIALAGDLDAPRRLVRVRDGTLEVLHRTVGLFGDLQFHVRGKTVVWSEYEVSPRWGEESFLVIKALDLDTKQVRRLTHRSRYYAPALSSDESRLVAVDFSRSRRATLVILDAASGRELQRLPNDAGHFLVTPTWSEDGKSLLVVAVDPSRGNALVRVPLDDGASAGARAVADTLIAFTHVAISRPVAQGGRVYFGSPRSGLDNIFVLDLATRSISQVTSRPLGASWPAVAPDGHRLAFSDYSLGGYDVAEMPLDPARFAPVAWGEPHASPVVDVLVRQEQGGSILDSLPAVTWPTRPFTGWARVFDFHSRSLVSMSDGINTALFAESRNLLNTVAVTVGPSFNVNERTLSLEAGASYGALPVLVDVAGRVGSRASTFTDSAGAVRPYTWRERSFAASLRLPLTRLDGQVRQSMVASATLGRTSIGDQPIVFRNTNNNGDFTSATYALSASQVRSAAYRDLFPVGGAAFLAYRHAPSPSEYRSHQATASASLYLPGAWRHHALVLDVAREDQRPANYRFSSLVRFPRGYASRFHETLTRAGATYHLPLLYPDLALGNWLYFRRVQGNVFGDVGRGSDRDGGHAVDYRSVGGEMTVEVSPLGLRTSAWVGVRVSQRLTGDRRSLTEAVVVLR